MALDAEPVSGDPERLKAHLDLLLLSVLAVGPAHGYAALRRRSDGAFDPPEGTVYPALHRLERAGLLAAHWERSSDGAGAGRRRKVYPLTGEGEAAPAGERAHWQRFRTGVGPVLQAVGTTA